MRRNCAGFYYIQFQFYYFLTVSVKVSTVDSCNSFWYSLQGAACLPRPIVIQVWHNYSYMTLIPLSTFLWMLGELLSSLHNIIIHDDIKNICVHVDAQNAQISPQSQSNYYKRESLITVKPRARFFFCYMGLFILCIMSLFVSFSILFMILTIISFINTNPGVVLEVDNIPSVSSGRVWSRETN